MQQDLRFIRKGQHHADTSSLDLPSEAWEVWCQLNVVPVANRAARREGWAMALDVKDAQNKSEVFADIATKVYKRLIQSERLTINNFNFKKPPDGWIISADQARQVDVELVIQKDNFNSIIEKHYDVWLKTKSPKGVLAKADIGTLTKK
jgi:hypothetical protein